MIRISETVGNRVRQARKDFGMSQELFAAAIGITQSKLSRIETGKSTDSIALIKAISDYTHKPMWFFFMEDGAEEELLEYLSRRGAPVAFDKNVIWMADSERAEGGEKKR